jgi:hypothetical protein
MTASPVHERVVRGHPWLLAGAAIDAFAAAMLLLHAPLSPGLAGVVAATAHVVAVVLLFGAAGASTSRGWLGSAAALTIPGAGVAVAAVAILTKGRHRSARRCGTSARRRAPRAMDALHRLGHDLCPSDALDRGDGEERRSALSALTRRADHEAIALLRRASAATDSDLALAAALALDKIGERLERGAYRLNPGELRRAAG